MTYAYDNNGNVTSITDSLFTGSRTFTYDDLNRMITGAGTFGTNQAQTSCTYAYNAIGNLTNKCGAVLTYGDTNHPSAVTNHSTLNKNYTYDQNGNMLTRGNQTLTWDIDNRVASVSISGGGTTSMEYDYSGTRVKKSAPSGITLYPFSGYEIDPNGVITKFIRVGGESIASKKGTAKYFYHNDHLGSVNVVTDIAGTRVQLNEYDPWGAVSRASGTIDPDTRFTGQKLDPETGLYYYGGRYYDAEIGRFISADPFIQTPYDPQNLNRYSYVINNPPNYIDPDGYFHQIKKKKPSFWKRFGGGLLGAFITLITWGAGAPFEAALMTGAFVKMAVDAANGHNPITAVAIPFGVLVLGAIYEGSPVIFGGNSESGFGNFIQLAQAAAAGDDKTSDAGSAWDWAKIIWAMAATIYSDEGSVPRLRDVPAGGTAANRERILRAREARANAWGIKQQRTSPKLEQLSPKIEKQLQQRGWTKEQITQAFEHGEDFPAVNRLGGANTPATRYINPQTGQSVVIDNATGEIIHVGGPGFRYSY